MMRVVREQMNSPGVLKKEDSSSSFAQSFPRIIPYSKATLSG